MLPVAHGPVVGAKAGLHGRLKARLGFVQGVFVYGNAQTRTFGNEGIPVPVGGPAARQLLLAGVEVVGVAVYGLHDRDVEVRAFQSAMTVYTFLRARNNRRPNLIKGS